MKVDDGNKNKKQHLLHQKKAVEPKPNIEALDEDQIMQSIDNLDMLLANINTNDSEGKN